jgi:predicted ATP-grasp superfamily ATP-dependent carboligase
VPALVLGSGLNGLGVARSLGAAGVPVYLGDADMRNAELRTRYAQALELSALQGDELLQDLIAVAKTRFVGQRPVLVLTQEQTVRTVARALDTLRPLFRFILPSGELLTSLMHKEGFDRLAEQKGLRVPRTVHVREAADIEAALALTVPLVIKPALHSPEYGGLFRKAYRVGAQAEARDLLERILPVLADVVVQEWIPGNDSDIYFCLQQISAEGKAEASFVGRKIRSWPPDVGGTASCISAEENANELIGITEGFFARVGMCGLASMEYKRHAVTGEFVAIEPTVGRTDYQEEVATLNGVNLPYAYYRSAIGEPCEAAASADVRSIIWRDRSADEQSSLHPDQTIHDWPSDHGAIRDALWRAADPGPWLTMQWQRGLRKGRNILNRFGRERTTT